MKHEILTTEAPTPAQAIQALGEMLSQRNTSEYQYQIVTMQMVPGFRQPAPTSLATPGAQSVVPYFFLMCVIILYAKVPGPLASLAQA